MQRKNGGYKGSLKLQEISTLGIPVKIYGGVLISNVIKRVYHTAMECDKGRERERKRSQRRWADKMKDFLKGRELSDGEECWVLGIGR